MLRKPISILLFLYSLPLFAQLDADDTYFYSSWYETSAEFYSNPIEKIYLDKLDDEVMIMRNREVGMDSIESIVKKHIPDATINWYRGLYCVVQANPDILNKAVDEIIDESAIEAVRPMYIKRLYNDLASVHPVQKIATIGFTNYIALTLESIDQLEQAERFAGSLGCKLEQIGEHSLDGRIMVSKYQDILKIETEMFQTGLFSRVNIGTVIGTKNVGNLSDINNSTPYFYVGDIKTYLYYVPNKLYISKQPDCSQFDLEGVIKEAISAPQIEWINSDICSVVCVSENMDDVLDKIRLEENVSYAQPAYIIVNDYKNILLDGTSYPKEAMLLNYITAKYNEGVSQDEKDNISKSYDISIIRESEVFFSFSLPKTVDIVSVTRELYETGLFKFVYPETNTLKIHFNSDPTPTNVSAPKSNSREISMEYFDLSGKKLTTPSGMTIEIRHYDDGKTTVRKVYYQ